MSKPQRLQGGAAFTALRWEKRFNVAPFFESNQLHGRQANVVGSPAIDTGVAIENANHARSIN